MRLQHLLASLCLILIVSGCGSTLKPPTLNPKTGRFNTGTKLYGEDIKVRERFHPDKYLHLLYVKTDAKSEKYNTFFLESFSNMQVFHEVVDQERLAAIVLERKLADRVPNISDLIGLHNLAKEIGPFLIVEPYAEFKGGYDFSARLKAIDPETGQIVLEIRKDAFNWAGLDKPLFYPLFNAFLEWSQGKSITTSVALTSDRKRQ